MFILKVLTPKGAIFTGEVDEVIAPTSNGEIGILTDHEALISSLSVGTIVISKNNIKETIICKGGFIKVKDNSVQMLVDEADLPKDLVMEKIKAAEEKAGEEISKTDLTTSQLIRLEKTLRYEKFKKDYAQREGI